MFEGPPAVKERALDTPEEIRAQRPREVPDAQALGRMRRDRRFKQFLEEKHQGGRGKVPHPRPDLRRRYPQGIKFWTAMKKYKNFHDAVIREFEAWKREDEQKAESPTVGEGAAAPSPAEPVAPPAPRRPRRPSTPRPSTLRRPVEEGWRERDAHILEVAREGEKVGHDTPLGTRNVNGAVKRRLKRGDEEMNFVWKSRGDEDTGQRVGIPQLAPREQAAYQIDALLGDGLVVPASTATPEGALQAFVPGTKSFLEGGRALADLSSSDLIQHPDVQRLTVLDAILGQEDRHHGNILFSWDDSGDKGIENLRVHAIDNGYCVPSGTNKRSTDSYEIRDPWPATVTHLSRNTLDDRWKIQRAILSHIPKAIHDKLKDVDVSDFIDALVESGIKDRSALEGAVVRLVVLQDNPEALKPLIDRHRNEYGGWMVPEISATQKGQRDWHYQSHHRPAQLIREHSELPASTLDDIQRKVGDAIGPRDEI